MKFERMTVRELSEEYGIPVRTIRDRINQNGFNMTFIRRKDGIRMFPVTDDFIEKVLTIHPRFRNLRKKEEDTVQVQVESLNMSAGKKEDVSVTLVFKKTDVRKFADFILRMGRS